MQTAQALAHFFVEPVYGIQAQSTESESARQKGTCWRPRSSVMLLDSGPRWAVVGMPACRFRSSSIFALCASRMRSRSLRPHLIYIY